MTRLRIPLLATGAFLLSGAPALSSVLLSENFDTADGGFTASAEPAEAASQWFWDDTMDAWNTPGQEGITINDLTSPGVAIPGPLVLRLTFSHRYDFEPVWDGGQVQYSVNGGDFVALPAIAFAENPYTESSLIGNHILNGKPAFSGKSAGYDEGSYISSVVDIPAQTAGTSLAFRFRGAWDEGTFGASPNWEITSVQLETLADTDSDGMPDVFEDANGLNKNVNDAALDKDSDGSTNLAEFQRRTNPSNPDSDGDGYRDGVETGTGTWVSATDTGSDPLNADTDDDGFPDGIENLSLAFTGLTQPGSDPNKADTDGDGWNDYTEAAFSADPKLTASKPTLNALPLHLLAYWNFDEAAGTTVALDESHSLRGFIEGAAISEDAEGRTGNAGDKALNLRPDLGANRTMRVGGDWVNLAGAKDSAAISFWQKLDAVSNSTAFKGVFIPASGDNRGIQAHATWGDNNYYFDTNGCCAAPSQRMSVGNPGEIDLTQWHHIVFQKNGPVKEIWVDGVMIASSTGAAPLPTNFQSFWVGSGQNGGEAINGIMDDFAVFAEALTEAQIQRLASGDSPLSLLPTADDADGDGMLDVYEIANGLNKDNANDRDLDKDGDGLTNLQEHTRGTRADMPDTDGDGLSDGVETGTGVFVSASNTGTDPLDTDSDDDGLPDNVETGTGVFVSASNTGTNPNNKDTDGDTLNDRYEVVVSGTSPVSNTSPTFGAGTGIGISFGGGATPIPPLAPTEIAGFAPVSQGNWNTTDAAIATGDNSAVIAPVAGTIVNAAGTATAVQIAYSSDNTYPAANGTASGNAKLMTGYLDETAGEVEEVITLTGIPYTAYDVYVYFGSDGNGRTGSIESVTADQEFFYVTSSGKGAAAGFKNDDFIPTTSPGPVGPAANFCVFRFQSGTSFEFQVNRGSDNSGVHGLQIVPLADGDSDGIPDAYEDANGLNKTSAADRDTDLDGDGLSNYNEFLRHTAANKTDTDGDGLTDEKENNSRTWVSAVNTGTSPLRADTDGDGLPDALEVKGAPPLGLSQPGSDPNLKDSDADTWDDYTEAAYGGNPLLDTSVPVLDSAPLHLLAWWPFDDASNPAKAVDVTHSVIGDLQFSAVYSPDGGGRSGQPGDKALDLTGPSVTGKSMLVPNGAFQNIAAANDQISVVFWQKLDAVRASTSFRANFLNPGADARAISAHATWDNNNFYWDTNGCCNSPGQRSNILNPGHDLTQWTHLVFQKNGPLKEIWANGELVLQTDGADPLPLTFQNLFVGGITNEQSVNGKIDDFAIFAEALTEAQIQTLAAGADPDSLISTTAYLPVSSVVFNTAARNLTLTFASTAGKSYVIERSSNLTAWSVIAAAHPSGGATTTYTDSALPATATRYFYRVSEAP